MKTLILLLLPALTWAQLNITTTALDSSTWGSAYQDTVIATGGTAPYVFRVFNRVLPTGTYLRGDGYVLGLPTDTAGGGKTFSVSVTDAAGARDVQELTLGVKDSTSEEGGGGTAFAYVGSKLDSTTSAAATDTISYTVGTGDNRKLIVMTALTEENSDPVVCDSVMWSGTKMTWRDSIVSNNGNWRQKRVEGFVLNNPASGSGNIIIYSSSASTNFQTVIVEYEGAAQGTDSVNHARDNYNATASVTVGTASGDSVVGFFKQWEGNTAMTPGSGETRLQGNYINNILVSKSATTTSTQLTETLTSAQVWVFMSFAIKPAE